MMMMMIYIAASLHYFMARMFCFYRYLGLEPRLTSGSIQGSGVDPQTQIAGAGVIGPASAEKNCKNAHLTAKQQAICSRSPPVLQVFTSSRAEGPRSLFFFLPLSFFLLCLSLFLGLMPGEARG